MKRKEILKTTIGIAIILMLAWFGIGKISNISNASEDDPSDIYFSSKINTEESSTPIKTSNGDDCYLEDDIIAVDFYLTTLNANISYFTVSASASSNVGGCLSRQEIKLSDEWGDLEEYVKISNGGIKFNQNKYADVYLNNSSEMKLFTGYYSIVGSSVCNDEENGNNYELISLKPSISSIERDSEELTPETSSYYSFCTSGDAVKMEDVEATESTIYVGDSPEITYTIYGQYTPDEFGNADYYTEYVLQDVIYTSSDDSIITTLSDGTLRAMGAGTVTITVTSVVNPDLYDTVEITVIENEDDVPVESISFGDASYTIQVPKTLSIYPSITPSNATNKSVYFVSSNPEVASIDQNGQITAVSVGTTTITAYSNNNKTATIEIEVVNEVEEIEILNPISSAFVSGYYHLQVRVTPDDENLESLVQYKVSKSNIATVDAQGNLECINKSGGTVKVTAYVGDVEDSFYVYFIPSKTGFVSTTGVEILNEKQYMVVGSTYQLESEVSPSNASNQLVNYYTSDSSIATVDSNGKITALKAGTVTVTAVCGNMYTLGDSNTYTDTYELTIVDNEVELTNISLDKHSENINVGATDDLTVSFTPDESTQDRTYTYEVSDNNVISISQYYENLTVTAKKVGTSTLTVKSTENENLTDSCDFTVYGFDFEELSVTINSDEPTQLNYYSVLPDGESEDDYTITFSSDDPNVVSVDENGIVTGNPFFEEGTTITLTASNAAGNTYTASIEVKIVTPVKQISISPRIIEVEVGETFSIPTVTIKPIYATLQSYYSTYDSNIIIEQNDYIEAVSEGVTEYTVTSIDGGYTDTCMIYVVSELHSDTTVYEAVESTCTTHGHREYEVCNICGEIVSGSDEELELDSTNHINTEIRNAVEATTEQEGYTGDIYCSDCGELIQLGETIPMIVIEDNEEEENNTQNETIEENIVEAEEVEETATEQENEEEQEISSSPKTGDTSNLKLWIVLLVVSGICIIVVTKSSTENYGKHSK